MLFNGSFSNSGKEYIKYLFHQQKDILISTEAGSQGLNLQFCKNLINYDLPWNPMKLEQRIGRIHRLGQTSNVNIFNLFTINTVEEKILKLLYEKIKLFKAVMGNMDNILMDTNRMNSLEKDILSILVEANDEKELEERFNELGNQLKQAAKI